MNKPLEHFVSVIIPVYHDLEYLKRCLNALKNQTYPRSLREVIVVNNDPAEDIESHIAQSDNVRVICESHRGSYAARNKGISNAKGTILAFTDSDCVPLEDWIEKGVQTLLSQPNIGLVAGKIRVVVRDPENPTAIELYEKIAAFPQKFYVEKQRYGATANLFTFKDVIEKVGCFNGRLLSSGDFDWGNRVFAAGYKQLFAEDACVLHPARRTFRQKLKKKIRIIRGRYELGVLEFSFRRFAKRLVLPVTRAKEIIFENKYENKLKGRKQKFKLVLAFFFEIYVSAFGGLVITLFGRKNRKKLEIH
jgi:glycosyltransferase involved in cell wall biosynthesis